MGRILDYLYNHNSSFASWVDSEVIKLVNAGVKKRVATYYKRRKVDTGGIPT